MARYVAVLAILLGWAGPAGAFTVRMNVPPKNPAEAFAKAPRWTANAGAFVSTGQRGLGGGLEFSVSKQFCRALRFVDGTTCADIHAAIVEAGRKWGARNPAIRLVDVTGKVLAERLVDNPDVPVGGAEIDFFAVTREQMLNEVPTGEPVALSQPRIVRKPPRSTDGQVLMESEGTVVKADVLFATDACYYLKTPTVPGVCVDFGGVLVHELGHVLGLAHPDTNPNRNYDSDDDPQTPVTIDCHAPADGLKVSPHVGKTVVMTSTGNDRSNWTHGPTDDDLAGIDFLYPYCAPDGVN